MQCSKQGMWKGYHLSIEGVRKGYCFFVKNGIQLFRERLSEKVHATIPKGIVGGFVCPVLQRNLKEWQERPRTYVGECWWKATKVGSTATVVRNSVLIISHITFRGCRVHIFSDNLSRNSCIKGQGVGPRDGPSPHKHLLSTPTPTPGTIPASLEATGFYNLNLSSSFNYCIDLGSSSFGSLVEKPGTSRKY